MQITTASLFLLAAIGAVATPIEPGPDSIDARQARIVYPGTCTRSNNQCKYQAQSGNNAIVACPSAANLKCTNDGRPCSFDSVNKKVTCG